MAHSDKNIIITPNIGSTTDDPKIVFSGADGTLGPQNITLKAYSTNNGTLSFEGSAGQLFSITNDLTGTIFSVNDISGIPSIEVNADGTVKLAEFNGVVKIGGTTAVKVPVGTNAQRPTGEQGMFRYNNTSYNFEGYNGSAWFGFGYTGSQGNIGFTGSQGIQGVTGFTGSQGSLGFTGSQGNIGFTGSQGIQGVTGFTGSLGFTGSQGIQGVTGFTGSVGFVGSQGIQGVTGFTGSVGFVGSQGIQGVTGFTGSVGFTGSTGFVGSKGYVTHTTSATPPSSPGIGDVWINSNTGVRYEYTYDGTDSSQWVDFTSDTAGAAVFIQSAAPSYAGPYLWIQTGTGDGTGVTFWVEDGV